MPTLRATLFAVCVLWLGCPSAPESPSIHVDLRTDLLPFVEFESIRLQVGDGELGVRSDHVPDSAIDYVRGGRVATLTLPAGDTIIRGILFRAGGSIAGEVQRRVVIGNTNQTITLVLSRDCRGVECPTTGNPSYDSCLGGQCVDPHCTPETPEFCPPPACTNPSDCEVPMCVDAVCDEGICLARALPERCEGGEFCDGTLGCRFITVNPDGGIDGGPGDAGVSRDMGADTPDAGGDAGPSRRPIGPRTVTATALTRGTLYAANDGEGTSCSLGFPCSIWEAASQAERGDVVFLHGGYYLIDRDLIFEGRGDAGPPPIFESYPGERAELAGSSSAGMNAQIHVQGSAVHLRLFDIAEQSRYGIVIHTSDHLLEGLLIQENLLSGVLIHDSHISPTSHRNIVRDCEIYGNSAVGIRTGGYDNGAHSDGISISSGEGNRVENCLIYSNSDDGIDTWRSTNTYIGYNAVGYNGDSDGAGEGVGIKAGGRCSPSRRRHRRTMSVL